MKPTVGRIVHYVTGAGEHTAAIIVGVHGAVVNLTIFSSIPGAVNAARDVVEDGTGFASGTWHWPEREG